MDCRCLGQGFGMAGIGVLIGSKGADTYRLGYFGQGAAAMGGVGWLIDPSGNDTYRSPGVGGDASTKAVARSRAQGYAGILPGGIGLLTDQNGDDLYEAASFAQASCDQIGIGSVRDFLGDDNFICTQSAQAFATHEGYAGLFDNAGDDAYMLRKGMGHAFAINRAVAVLIDRDGDDITIAQKSEPAFSQEGAFALFIDADGSDRYAGPAGTVVKFGARSAVSIFVDLGGENKFADGPAPDSAVTNDTGVALATGETITQEPENELAVGSLKLGESEINLLWDQVSAQGARSTSAGQKLVAVGVPALIEYLDSRLDQSNCIPVALGIIATQRGSEKLIQTRYEKSSNSEKSTLLTLASKAKLSCLKGEIPGALDVDETSRAAVEYAMSLGSKEYFNNILPLVLNGDPLTSQQAALAMAQMGEEKNISSMEALMNSKDLLVRKVALNFIARFPMKAEPLAKSLIAKDDEKSQLNAVELMVAMGGTDQLRLAGSGLNSQFTAVRIRTMILLNHRVPESYRSRIFELTKDGDPIVAAVARGVDLGR
jgi:hypothetical protein